MALDFVKRSWRRIPPWAVLLVTLSVLATLLVPMYQQFVSPPESEPQTTAVGSDAEYVGSAACAGCHTQATTAWRDSHPAQAMQVATAATVLGNFDDAQFQYGNVTSTFFKKDDRYFVNTDGSDGTLTDFEITYTFGVDPLQQYLIEFPDGRLQTLSIAWDSRPEEQGGQRWFHLYPDEIVQAGDRLHWTGLDQNWNFMCADCHTTNLRKGYEAKTDTFRTHWTEIGVGCEACHGPASNHLAWAETRTADPAKGLTVKLDERRGGILVHESGDG